MAEQNKSPEQLDPELDSLLDDALEDFNKPLVQNVAPGAAQPCVPGALGAVGLNSLLTEDVIKQATQNFEASMRAVMLQQQNVAAAAAAAASSSTTKLDSSGSGASSQPLPADVARFDIGALTEDFAKFAQAASRVSAENSVNAGVTQGSALPPHGAASTGEGPDFQKLLSDTMQQLAQNNQEYQSAPTPDELGQLLEGLGLGGGAGGEAGAAGLMPLMQSMLENILSKDILYQPIKEIVDKYPDWLADNRSAVEPAEFDRYSRQYDIMKQVVDLFESEKESDSDEVKSKRFEDLIQLMQKLQEEGHPPTELAGDIAGNMAAFANLDPTLSDNGLAGEMPDFGALLGNLAAAGAAPPSTGSSTDPPNSGEEQCSIM